MIPKFIKINGFTRKDRNEMIALLSDAISKGGGWILDHKMYSNASINYLFELPVKYIKKLSSAVKETELKLRPESQENLTSYIYEVENLSLSEKEGTIIGTLQVTFIHNDPDLKIKVPPIPG